VLNLLADLQARRGLTYLSSSATTSPSSPTSAPMVGVMQGGLMVETVSREDLRAGRTVHPRIRRSCGG
jgi:peptide/nickel transport system ATP-binding protein